MTPLSPRSSKLAKPPPKQKSSATDWRIVGLDLEPSDLPSPANPQLRTILFAPAFTSRDAAQTERFRTNVAVILRAYDYFFDLQELPNFWSRLRTAVSPLYSAANMDAVVKRYVAARRRFVEAAGGSARAGKGLDLVITTLADKLHSNSLRNLCKRNPKDHQFTTRVNLWAKDSKNLDTLLGSLRDPATKKCAAISTDVDRSESKSSPKAEMSKQELPDVAKSPSDGGQWISRWLRSTEADEIAPGDGASAMEPFTSPTVAPMSTWALNKPRPHGAGQLSKDETRLPATARAKRPAARDFMSPDDSKRRAVEASSPYSPQDISGTAVDRVSRRSASVGSSDAYSPAKSFAKPLNMEVEAPARKSKTKILRDNAVAGEENRHGAELVSESSELDSTMAGSERPGIVIGGKTVPAGGTSLSPDGGPAVFRDSEELQRLQQDLLGKTQQIQQVQGALKLANDTADALQQKVIGMGETIAQLDQEKAMLANDLKITRDKLATATAMAPATPTTTVTQVPTVTPDTQLQLKQFAARRDYKGLLAHIAAKLPQMADPIVSSLRQEAGDEQSAAWKALEHVWIALDWAEKQATLSAESL
ncbi:uncharacterized protein B0I36DRAFT_350919 [Microdochium trichocladiopsis]|uniref:Uncharacterized protein n=1 Tax=Microdochium trichocladiopsis TaxID=1682393 RepID=A0A9P8Y4F8_9PEZI|nr:uncharacterized protein B0I36DRAFT_350919 [Microdochium trichocladiopsis]KAH7027381.1 hypothetical protein B0I36DRAFT_350919 [Microdochium trichocladiopsis]